MTNFFGWRKGLMESILGLNMSGKIRLFVALFPPPAVVEALAAPVRRLAAALPGEAVTWTAPEQIHLTLNFIGNVEPAAAGLLENAVREACRGGRAFPLRARGLGCFPSPARARILWAGLEATGGTLEALKANLDAALARLGCPPETRPFHPHLTIGRVKSLRPGDGRTLAAALGEFRQTDFGQWTAEQIELMQSTLLPAGAKYSSLAKFELANAY
jgi:2'-5' RNA ligase